MNEEGNNLDLNGEVAVTAHSARWKNETILIIRTAADTDEYWEYYTTEGEVIPAWNIDNQDATKAIGIIYEAGLSSMIADGIIPTEKEWKFYSDVEYATYLETEDFVEEFIISRDHE